MTIRISAYSGLQFDVRQSLPDDERGLAEFWKHVAPVDLARHAIGVAAHSGRQVALDAEASRTVTFLALGGDDEIVAIGMLVTASDGKKAEVSVFTREGTTYHGISWALLEHILQQARADGVQTVESILGEQDVRAIRLERKMGFVEADYPGGAGLKILRWTFAEPA